MLIFTRFISIFAFCSCAFFQIQAAPHYAVKDLHAYFDNDLDIDIQAFAINANGLVAGDCEYDVGGEPFSQVFVLDLKNDTLTLISPPQTYDDLDDHSSYFKGLNDQNQVLLEIEEKPFLWDSTNGLQAIDISSLPTDEEHRIFALELNNLGQVLLAEGPLCKFGWFSTDLFIWEADKGIHRIPLIDIISKEYTVRPFKMNDKGQILFYLIHEHSYTCIDEDDGEESLEWEWELGYGLYDNGSLVKYDMPPDMSAMIPKDLFEPRGLNNHGDVLVFKESRDIGIRSFLNEIFISKSDGQKISLNIMKQSEELFDFGLGFALNDAMHVVGIIETCALADCDLDLMDPFYGCDNTRIGLWTPENGWVEIADLICTDFRHLSEKWVKPHPRAINNKGQILIYDEDDFKVYVLTPIDE